MCTGIHLAKIGKIYEEEGVPFNSKELGNANCQDIALTKHEVNASTTPITTNLFHLLSIITVHALRWEMLLPDLCRPSVYVFFLIRNLAQCLVSKSSLILDLFYVLSSKTEGFSSRGMDMIMAHPRYIGIPTGNTIYGCILKDID